MKNINVKKQLKPLSGEVTIPADKSISHRAAMFAALTGGTVEITNYSLGADCLSTLNILKQLGVNVEIKGERKLVISAENTFVEPNNVLDAGNSGTTTRLMSGVLAGQDFYSVITGDASLRSRPMARVIDPLKQMGADIWAKNNDTKAPISIKGGGLKGINYNSPMASAQVKSAILLAGLYADGVTTVTEPYKSRSHTERMLKYLGANIAESENSVSIEKSQLVPRNITVPGDISSAAFFMAAGAIVPGSEIIIRNIGLNPTRTGVIDVLTQMGADITILNQRVECEEEVGDLVVKSSSLKGITIEGDIIPRIIDEIPVIAVVASQAEGTTVIKDAEELRHKESDRIKTTVSELKKLGADVQETPDGLIIEGKSKLAGGCVLECYHDHRIAMAGYVAGLVCENPIQINEFNWVDISFPEFLELFDKIS